MNDMTLNLLISSIAGLLTALIGAGSQIIIELIRAQAGRRTEGIRVSEENGVTDKDPSPKEIRSQHKNRKVLRYLPVFLVTFITVSLIFYAVLSYRLSTYSNDMRRDIESFPLIASQYGGENDPTVGKGTSRLSVLYTTEFHPGYTLNYTLPDDGSSGYAGLVFTFSEVQDLSIFAFIEFKIILDDSKSSLEVYLKDVTKQGNYVLVGGSITASKNIMVRATGNELIVKIQLKDTFNQCNFKTVKELGFSVDAKQTQGSHRFTVSEIKFTKS